MPKSRSICIRSQLQFHTSSIHAFKPIAFPGHRRTPPVSRQDFCSTSHTATLLAVMHTLKLKRSKSRSQRPGSQPGQQRPTLAFVFVSFSVLGPSAIFFHLKPLLLTPRSTNNNKRAQSTRSRNLTERTATGLGAAATPVGAGAPRSPAPHRCCAPSVHGSPRSPQAHERHAHALPHPLRVVPRRPDVQVHGHRLARRRLGVVVVDQIPHLRSKGSAEGEHSLSKDSVLGSFDSKLGDRTSP